MVIKMTYVLESYSLRESKYKVLNAFSSRRFDSYESAKEYCRTVLFKEYDFCKRHDPIGDYYPDFRFVVYKGKDGKDYFEDRSSGGQLSFRGYYVEE